MVWIILVSIVIGLIRLFIPGHELTWLGTYEALAHIWVGILIALLFYERHQVVSFLCLLIITVIEVVMFTLR